MIMTIKEYLTSQGFSYDYAKRTYYKTRSDCCDAPITHAKQKDGVSFYPTCDECNNLCKRVEEHINE